MTIMDSFSSSSSSSPPSQSPSFDTPCHVLSHSCTHQVFPSFHGADVRKNFLSHVLKEFRNKGIEPFIDNNIERSKSIGPELKEAIRGSKISIILLSKNYAASSWCLNELVEIIKCREELGQIVMTVFYKVDPTDVKKQTRHFGKVFKKTCKGKTYEDIIRWRYALAKVAKIAGYQSKNWDNEAAMIEEITSDISNKLNNSTPSNDFDDLIGMEAHLEKMEPLLCLGSPEVRMIGIWGPSGIGKTTIARFLFKQHSESFQLSVFMENIKANMFTRPDCSDDYSTKLHLLQRLMSQLLNQKDIEIRHLGVARDRLKDKKVLVVLDDVDRSIQLHAMAKETRWFGPGSRIIITTQDKRLLRAHGIEYIYEVGFPASDEAFQIFCMYAFGQNSPKDGFEELAWEVTRLVGELPLGLKVMGAHLRGMSEQEWRMELPRLRNHLSGDIESVLKFCYDALDSEEQDLFLHIAFFGYHMVLVVEELLRQRFLNLRSQLRILYDKSLINVTNVWINMHNLLAQLGREIVRKQSIYNPGERKFLVDARDIYEVLTHATGTGSVVGIELKSDTKHGQLTLSERGFEGMYNLQFLTLYGHKIDMPRGLNYLPHKLRLLYWPNFKMTCLPSNFRTDFLVVLIMKESNLEKLWEGIQPLHNLKWMYLDYSKNLKELPDLSTASNLYELYLSHCSSLVKLPSSIGNATNLNKLYLSHCSSLLELPSSIGNLHKLERLRLEGCTELESLPTNINLESLIQLDLSYCSRLKSFPEISSNVIYLSLQGTAIEEVPSSIKSWSRLSEFHMSFFANLKEFPHALERITILYFEDLEIEEIPPWIKRLSSLLGLTFKGCRKLVSIPPLPDSLLILNAKNCESLESLDCSFFNRNVLLNFANCFKLNQKARELIMKTTLSDIGLMVLPGRKIPMYFTNQAVGNSLTMKLNERALPTSLKFKVCIILAEREVDTHNQDIYDVESRIKQNGYVRTWIHFVYPVITNHLYIFELEAEMTSSELLFEFDSDIEIRECGVMICTSKKETPSKRLMSMWEESEVNGSKRSRS